MRALEEALENFAGCAVVISHDRWFLDRIATHMLAFEGESKVVWFEGNYSEYEADRKGMESQKAVSGILVVGVFTLKGGGLMVSSPICLSILFEVW